MRRFIALYSEIIDGGDDTSPKNPLPDAIDRHARGQRIIRGEQPIRKSQTITSRFVRGQVRQDRWRQGNDRLALVQEISPNVNVRWPRL